MQQIIFYLCNNFIMNKEEDITLFTKQIDKDHTEPLGINKLKLDLNNKNTKKFHKLTIDTQLTDRQNHQVIQLSISPLNKLKGTSNRKVNNFKTRLSIGGSSGGLISFSKLLKESCKSLKDSATLTVTTARQNRNNEYDFIIQEELPILEENQYKDSSEADEDKSFSYESENEVNKLDDKHSKSKSNKEQVESIEAYYTEEDKFLDELSEDYKKFFIHSVDNCYGNYDVYVTNSLMLTTILPCREYFTQEIQKRKVEFKISPFKKLLLLDLDETLIHTDFEYKFDNHDIYLKLCNDDGNHDILPINIRPYVKEFLVFASKFFDIVIFTASKKEYAEVIVNFIDPERVLIKEIFDRSHCIIYKNLFLKFIDIFNIPAKECIIIDNSIFSFAYNLSNGILVTSFYNEKEDQDMVSVIELLETYLIKCHDVREVLDSIFEFDKIRVSLKDLKITQEV